MRYFRVKNFDKFQHYRDRNPPWIKLHVALLDDYQFGALPDASKAHLLGIWILASKSDNLLPVDPEWIARRIGATEPLDLEQFFEVGFLVLDSGEAGRDATPWASRYVSAAMRAEVLASTGGKCAKCGCAEDLEIDHIIPISKGGTGERANLQPLCRKCNRAKRVRIEGKSAEQPAPQKRSPEESRGEAETEKKPPCAADAAPPKPDYKAEFAAIRSLYPKREGAHGWPTAFNRYVAHRKRGVLFEDVERGVRAYSALMDANGKAGTEYVVQAQTFFGPQRRWEESYQPAPRTDPLDADIAALVAQATDFGRMSA